MGAQEVQVSALQTYIIENSLHFGRGWVEVREYTWRRPIADTWTSDGYFLDLSLTRRAGPARGAYLDTDGRIADTLGRILFVPPGRVMHSGGLGGKQRSMHCVLAPEMIDGLLPNRPVWDEAKLADGLRLNSPEIEWLLLRIYRELREEGFAVKAMVEALASALAIALVRRYGLDVEAAERRVGGLAPWRLRRIRERINSDQRPPRLDELAELCGLSVRHLCRAFKEETGQTIAKAVEEATVARARTLLAEAGASVTDVARTLGFSSAGSFSYAFRRATGLRPSEIAPRRRRRTAG